MPWEKSYENIKFCEKPQLDAMFFPLCERAEPDNMAPIALPPSKLEKWVFLRSYDVPAA